MQINGWLRFIHYWVVPFVDFFAVFVQKKEQVSVLFLTIYVVMRTGPDYLNKFQIVMIQC